MKPSGPALVAASAVLLAAGVLLVATGAALRPGYILICLGLVSSSVVPVALLLRAARNADGLPRD